MAPPHPAATDGSKTFKPSQLFDDDPLISKFHNELNSQDFRAAIITAFSLPSGDSHTYHATATVNLAQVQAAISAGPVNGLHDWYLNDDGKPTNQHPPTADISSYISLFDPSKAAANTLKSFQANAKKDSLRAQIAKYLTSKRYSDPSLSSSSGVLSIPKRKTPHQNPYMDFWAWSCHSLQYAGPDKNTSLVKTSHHVLPVFMHHFGCVVPSYEALEIISRLASLNGNNGSVIDMGSGNGYWTFMLRRQGVPNVTAVDNGSSKWRTTWIDDTKIVDGVAYLHRRNGAADSVLLLVYPIVGAGFTVNVLDAFKGGIVCVAGTQNGNGYTGFKNQMIDQWMEMERGGEDDGFEKIAQVPLPSFAGKDDALFVFRRKKRKTEDEK